MQSAERSRAKRALQATTSTWCRVDTRKSDERLQRTVDVCGKVYQQVALIASRRNSVIKFNSGNITPQPAKQKNNASRVAWQAKEKR